MQLTQSTILITGVAGFIGANVAAALLKTYPDARVIGVDNLNHYYDVNLKRARLRPLQSYPNFTFIKGNLCRRKLVQEIFQTYHPTIVIHLAAQAGVRHSITNPDGYIQSNIMGFYHIIEACRHANQTPFPIQHFLYASSSSVYGNNPTIPYRETDNVQNPVSLYAATKVSNELLAAAYANLYHIPTTGLRFFTVYGPAGRPDMAYFDFTKRLLAGENIRIFNYGHCQRDFTYIDDVVICVLKLMTQPVAGHRIFNVGKGHPDELLDFVQILQTELVAAGLLPPDYDFAAHQKLLPMQPGDVPVTYADTRALVQTIGYQPQTDLRTGLKKFVLWYRDWRQR